jgi:hypothetical protein
VTQQPERGCSDRGHQSLFAEVRMMRLGPTPDDITQWIGEILTGALPNGATSIDVTEAARRIAAWLQPIGVFNGGGSLCVLTDPDHWPYPELAITSYRHLVQAAEAADRARKDPAG